MISSIAIENFKAFGKKQKLPIKPITLIFGPNSSGKSSIIHSLLFAQHALETGKLDVFHTKGGGHSVDLGGFKQYIFKGNAENLFTWSARLNTKNLKGRLLELLASTKTIEISVSIRLPQEEVSPGEYIYAENPIVTSFFVSADNEELFSMGARKDTMLHMERLKHKHPVFKKLFKDMIEGYTTIQKVTPEDWDHLKKIVSDVIPDLKAQAEKLFPKTLEKLKVDSQDVEPMLITVSRGNRKNDIQKAVVLFLPRILNEILGELHGAMFQYLKNLSYLGPLRSYPPRHLAFLESEDKNWYAGGGFAWEVLRKNSDVREKVNAWLGDKDKLQTPYRLDIKEFAAFEEISSEYLDAVEELEQRFTDTEKEYDWDLFGELYSLTGKMKQWSQKRSNVKELFLKDLRTDTTVSHRDVGIGISQIIPVLVSAYANQNKLIAIEQPEIHIHPGLQAELGDLFIESALGENRNTYILETHSEHLILRILRRIRETTRKINKVVPYITPDDISLAFIDSTKKGSVIKTLRVDDRGKIIDKVPGGFFEEDFKELF